MLQWLKDFNASAGTMLTQYNNGTFKDAAMAVCALVAAADGKVDAQEKTKVAALIGKNELLQVFNATELRDAFLKYCEMAGDEFSRLDLLNIVRKLRANEGQADTAMKVALIIANSDGDFAASEQRVVREVCGVLGLPADKYVAA